MFWTIKLHGTGEGVRFKAKFSVFQDFPLLWLNSRFNMMVAVHRWNSNNLGSEVGRLWIWCPSDLQHEILAQNKTKPLRNTQVIINENILMNCCKSVLWSVSIRFPSVWDLWIDSISIINLCQVLCAQVSILDLDHCLEVFV